MLYSRGDGQYRRPERDECYATHGNSTIVFSKRRGLGSTWGTGDVTAYGSEHTSKSPTLTGTTSVATMTFAANDEIKLQSKGDGKGRTEVEVETV